MTNANDYRFDGQGRPFQFALQFSTTTGYAFHLQVDAIEFALSGIWDNPPEVVPYTPPTEEEAAWKARMANWAHNELTVPCQYTP